MDLVYLNELVSASTMETTKKLVRIGMEMTVSNTNVSTHVEMVTETAL